MPVRTARLRTISTAIAESALSAFACPGVTPQIVARNWAVICIATPDYLGKEHSWRLLGAFAAGLAATFMAAYYLFAAASRARTNRLLAQLESVISRLNEEVEQRRSAEAEVSRLNAHLAKTAVPEPVQPEELRHLYSRKEAEHALRESEQRYALAALGSKDGLWDWNLLSDRVYYSPRWKNMLGYAEDQIGDLPEEWLGRIHRGDVERVKSELEAHRAGMTPHFQSEYRIRGSNGAYCWMLARGVAIFGSEDCPARMAGSQTDITDGKVADPLTGLRTRLFLLDRLEMAIERMREERASLFAVLFLDLDRFKVVNDSLGHLMGDRLLAGIARRLQSCAEQSELDPSQITIARLGGDEFAVLLERIETVETAASFADAINYAMKPEFMLDGHTVFASASIGVAPGSAETTPENILRDADTAMYKAKAHGRERYEIFDSSMRTEAIERLELETELRNAIHNGELDVCFQPQIAMATGKVVEFEVLVQWRHPRRGLIMPIEFIPLAEETGLILLLGTWTLEQACRQLATWHQEFPAASNVGISVNLSPRQFGERDLVTKIAHILRESSLPARRLSIEITESVLLSKAELAISILNELRAMHVGLKIDDFGTGFFSLNHLHRLPFNELKIDRSFVQSMGQQQESTQIVRTIILLARSLRMSIVAEGVKQVGQLEQLAALGCDSVQGDLLCPPLDAEAARVFLEKNLLSMPASLTKSFEKVL